MWNLTPATELLKELPLEYTCETALADLIVSTQYKHIGMGMLLYYDTNWNLTPFFVCLIG